MSDIHYSPRMKAQLAIRLVSVSEIFQTCKGGTAPGARQIGQHGCVQFAKGEQGSNSAAAASLPPVWVEPGYPEQATGRPPLRIDSRCSGCGHRIAGLGREPTFGFGGRLEIVELCFDARSSGIVRAWRLAMIYSGL
jgi:hypothetical protein